MSHVDRRFAGEPTDPALALFRDLRSHLALALASWLNTRPESAELDMEVDATVAVVRGLVALARGARP